MSQIGTFQTRTKAEEAAEFFQENLEVNVTLCSQQIEVALNKAEKATIETVNKTGKTESSGADSPLDLKEYVYHLQRSGKWVCRYCCCGLLLVVVHY